MRRWVARALLGFCLGSFGLPAFPRAEVVALQLYRWARPHHHSSTSLPSWLDLPSSPCSDLPLLHHAPSSYLIPLVRSPPFPSPVLPSPMFPFAPSPDVYRSAEKDEAVLSRLRDDFTDLALQWGGQRWSGRHAEVDLIAAAAYYGLTQLRGQPSLGEEYCDIRQVTQLQDPAPAVRRAGEGRVGGQVGPSLAGRGAQALPSFDLVLPTQRRRVALFVLQVLAPYAYAKAKRQQQQTGLPPTPPSPSTALSTRVAVALSRAWHRLLSLIPVVDAFLPHLQRFHLALFFLTGRYLSLPHRLTSSRYIAVRPPDQQRASYTALGLLLLLQLATVGVIKARQGARWGVKWWRERMNSEASEGRAEGRARLARETQRDEEVEEEVGGVEDATARQCILHLGPVRDPTATECGSVTEHEAHHSHLRLTTVIRTDLRTCVCVVFCVC